MPRIRQVASSSIFLGVVFPPLLFVLNQSSDMDAKDIVKMLDALYRSEASFGEMEMQIVTPHWERTLRMQVWTKGTDKTFIRITSPQKERGVATLRLGNEMWNYLPNTNKVIKIPPSMMMSAWMGSDFTNDDLVSEFSLLEDYYYRFVTPEAAQADFLYIESKAREGLPIVWGKIVTTVRKDDCIPVVDRYYDEEGKLMRVMNFKDLKLFSGRKIPATMELIPQNKEGHKTVIRYLKLEFDIKISEDIFSLRNLRSRS